MGPSPVVVEVQVTEQHCATLASRLASRDKFTDRPVDNVPATRQGRLRRAIRCGRNLHSPCTVALAGGGCRRADWHLAFRWHGHVGGTSAATGLCVGGSGWRVRLVDHECACGRAGAGGADDIDDPRPDKASGIVVLPLHIAWSGDPRRYDLADRQHARGSTSRSCARATTTTSATSSTSTSSRRCGRDCGSRDGFGPHGPRGSDSIAACRCRVDTDPTADRPCCVGSAGGRRLRTG